MDRKVSIIFNTEKSIDNFFNKFRQCEQCNIKECLKLYYKDRNKISN